MTDDRANSPPDLVSIPLEHNENVAGKRRRHALKATASSRRFRYSLSNIIKDAPASLISRATVANLRTQQEEPQVTTQKYQQATERFLAQARQELAVGDLPQASEKGWGTTAQILKAVAEQRGWEHDRHRHYLRITSRLRSETGDGDIRRLFNTASALHENFYENEMETADVADGLNDVEALINKLIPLLSQT